MNASKKSITTTSKKKSVARRRGFLGFFFRMAAKEVSDQFFDGADIGRFNLSVPQAQEFVRTVANAYVKILVDGDDPTPENFLKLGHVRRTLSDLVMHAIALKSERIALPLSDSPTNHLRSICEKLIHEHAREVVPDGIIIKQKFAIHFVGGAKSNSEAQLPKGTARPTPVLSSAAKTK